MKLTCKQDIDAPAAFVLAQIADFDSWERAAMRRGVAVERSAGPGGALSWTAVFRHRGRERRLTLEDQGAQASGGQGFALGSDLADATVGIEVAAMAARRARLFVTIEVRPRTFAARLYVQSLRLARARVDARLAQRVAAFAREIEARAQRAGA